MGVDVQRAEVLGVLGAGPVLEVVVACAAVEDLAAAGGDLAGLRV